jgi:hypothetical protein
VIASPVSSKLLRLLKMAGQPLFMPWNVLGSFSRSWGRRFSWIRRSLAADVFSLRSNGCGRILKGGEAASGTRVVALCLEGLFCEKVAGSFQSCGVVQLVQGNFLLPTRARTMA